MLNMIAFSGEHILLGICNNCSGFTKYPGCSHFNMGSVGAGGAAAPLMLRPGMPAGPLMIRPGMPVRPQGGGPGMPGMPPMGMPGMRPGMSGMPGMPGMPPMGKGGMPGTNCTLRLSHHKLLVTVGGPGGMPMFPFPGMGPGMGMPGMQGMNQGMRPPGMRSSISVARILH